MRQHRRLEEIQVLLHKRRELTVDAVRAHLNVSAATVRRDFNLLVDNRKAMKTWGGIALPLQTGMPDLLPTDMQPLEKRTTLHLKIKQNLAEKAVSLMSDGDIAMIDGGSTTLQMVPYLCRRPIKVITNSLVIAHELYRKRGSNHQVEVLLTGGILYPNSGMLVGPQTVSNLRDYRAQWCFLSTSGIADGSLTNSNMLVAEVEKTMAQQVGRVVLVADHSKFGHRDLVQTLTYDDLHVLITDGHPDSRKEVSIFRKQGKQVLLC